MIPRRDVIEGLFKTGMAALGSRVLPSTKEQPPQPPTAGPVSEHALPPIPLDHWTLTVMEISYPAGSCSCPRVYPGFVIGYVLQGGIRLQTQGKAERTYRAGQIFYHPQESAHQVSANVSAEHPARLLALVFVKPGCTKSTS
jgi:quercetin dioxygenase-like cupin family protein